jgi:hypothetical protein
MKRRGAECSSSSTPKKKQRARRAAVARVALRGAADCSWRLLVELCV